MLNLSARALLTTRTEFAILKAKKQHREKQMKSIRQLIIIGGGPAGYTAALYAARAGIDVLLIESTAPGGQMGLTDKIDNYPGFNEGIEGFDLAMRMQAGAERFGAETAYDTVLSAELMGEVKAIHTTGGVYYAHSVIIATGASPRRLGAEGEDELISRGVHYCAHCDGGFYRGKRVAVIGGGNSAVADATYLSNLAEGVTLIHRRDALRATKVYEGVLAAKENITLITPYVVKSITRDGANGLLLTLSNTQGGTDMTLTTDGVFISIGREPVAGIFAGELDLTPDGYIAAGEDTKTNIPGVFAAGDVRKKALYQIVTAAADGAVSAHFAEEYLTEKSIL